MPASCVKFCKNKYIITCSCCADEELSEIVCEAGCLERRHESGPGSGCKDEEATDGRRLKSIYDYEQIWAPEILLLDICFFGMCSAVI